MVRILLLGLCSLFLFTSCRINIFDPIDSPDGDAQNLSAARACFDDGDLPCASEYYQKVSGNQADTASAEQAFLLLTQAGITMEFFADAFGDAKTATGINTLAKKLAPSAGSSMRQNIFSAYLQHRQITNPNLKYFVRFITSTVLLSELFGELAASDNVLNMVDIATGGTSCKELSGTNCAASANCNAGISTNGGGSITLSDLTSYSGAVLTGTVSTALIFSAMAEVSSSLALLGASGKFDSGVKNVVDVINALPSAVGAIDDGGAGDRCFRYGILSQGIGE